MNKKIINTMIALSIIVGVFILVFIVVIIVYSSRSKKKTFQPHHSSSPNQTLQKSAIIGKEYLFMFFY